MQQTSRQRHRRAAEPSSDLPTLVFVSRRQCGTCRRMESLVAWIKVTKKRHLRVVELDADRSPELALYLGARTTPTLILLRNGVVLDRLEGRATGAQIDDLVAPHLSERSDMSDHHTTTVEESGYAAAEDGDLSDAPDQAQPDERRPARPAEAPQDDYANTDEHTDD